MTNSMNRPDATCSKYVDDEGRILDPVSANGSDKAAAYGWASLEAMGQRGSFEMVSPSLLRISPEYQRSQTPSKITRMLKHFKWAAFGTIIVSKRGGLYHVIDGGHRAVVAYKHNHINNVPCMVYDGLTVAEEASLYIYFNTHRKAPDSVQVFQAAMVSKDALAVAIWELCESFGIRISRNRKDLNSCACPGALRAVAQRKNGIATLTETLRFINECWPTEDRKLTNGVIRGVALFSDRFTKALGKQITCPECVSRMARAGFMSISQSCEVWRNTGRNQMDAFCIALQEAWNKGRRTHKVN